MKFKKLLSALLVGASLMAISQSAFAASAPAAAAPVSQPKIQAVSSQAAWGNMWFEYDGYTDADGIQSTAEIGATYVVSGSGVNANFNISQYAPNGTPQVIYTLVKENSSWAISPYVVSGNTSESHSVYLAPGTYYFLVDVQTPDPVRIYGTLGTN